MSHRWRRFVFAVAITPALLLASYAAIAQTAYPIKPVRLLVGFGPGGGQDITARILARHLSTSWGQPVVVENRAGANGMIAAAAVAAAAPDRYTPTRARKCLSIRYAIWRQ